MKPGYARNYLYRTGKALPANKHNIAEVMARKSELEKIEQERLADAKKRVIQIEKIGKNKYVLGSMKDRSLYFFELDSNKKIFNLERIEVNERIRDLHFNNDNLYLFLEDSASIGIIELN